MDSYTRLVPDTVMLFDKQSESCSNNTQFFGLKKNVSGLSRGLYYQTM